MASKIEALSQIVKMKCTPETFKPILCENVRWLLRDNDYDLMAAFCRQAGYNLTPDEWYDANSSNAYKYAGLIIDNNVISTAALIPYSTIAWEVGAVGTQLASRRKGYAKRVISYVTGEILGKVSIATCSTKKTNVAMIQTALSVGYTILTESEACQYEDLINLFFQKCEQNQASYTEKRATE